MKKFTILALAVALTVTTASATEITVKHPVNLDNLGPIKTWEEVSKDLYKASTTEIMTAKKSEAPVLNKAPMTAPPAMLDLTTMQWEGGYTGMLSSNSGKHTGDASFTYYEEYKELDLTLPDFAQGLYVGYEDGNLIVYGSVGYGTNSSEQTYKLQVVNTSGTPTNQKVTIPYDEATKSFTFPSTFAWALCVYSGNTRLGYLWAAYQFSLVASDGDYSINIDLEDECTPDNVFKFKATAGKDAAALKCYTCPMDIDAATLTSWGANISALSQQIVSGAEYTIDANTLNLDESGYIQLIFTTYDADGVCKKTKQVGLIVTLDGEEGWNNVATVEYTDQLFSQYYEKFSHTADVLLQEKAETPGLYRFVNPYKGHARHHNDDCNHYITVDATDDSFVNILFSNTGLNVGGDGILTMGTFGGALGYTKEQCTTKGYPVGSKNDNVITFPEKSILAHEQYYNTPGNWSYMNSSNVVITLPEIELEVAVVDQDDNAVENASVKFNDDETEYLTDANGKVTYTVPFETGYFGTVAVVAQKADENNNYLIDEGANVKLNGAKNNYVFKYGVTTGIDSVVDNENAPVVYYNLQGMRVTSPAKGELVIKRQGSTTSKIVVR